MYDTSIIIRDRNFKIVSRSRNLRGIMEYSRRKSTAYRIDLYRGKNGWSGGQFGIAWHDGSTAICDFADFSIMESFAKKRTFKGAEIKIHPVMVDGKAV